MKNESLEAISERGDELETLQALRRKVSKALDTTTSAREIAALSRQLQQLVPKIHELEAQKNAYSKRREFEAIISSKRKMHHGFLAYSDESQDEEETADEC